MGEYIFKGFISLIVAIIVVLLVFWVFDMVGIHLPALVEKLVWVIVILFTLLWLYRGAKKKYPGAWW